MFLEGAVGRGQTSAVSFLFHFLDPIFLIKEYLTAKLTQLVTKFLNRNISNTLPGPKRVNRPPDSWNNCWPLASFRVLGGQSDGSSAWRFAQARSWFDPTVLAVGLLLASYLSSFAEVAPVEYLSDRLELILSSSQDWGALGFDVAAHQPDQAGLPLQIGQKQFTKGLGHHANGAIVILLDGEYAGFNAEVGLQPCSGGSVVFRIVVDGQPRFDSGELKAGDAPKPAQVSLTGAQELRLEAKDAGDGINCDMANWAEARLTRAVSTARTPPPEPPVDIARFARVVTWDPHRMDGCRANRIQEFRAEDVFLETDVLPKQDGTFTAPVTANGVACIGLQWLNRRALKELSLEFVDPAQVPATNSVQVQGWFGESAWQGSWKPLAGEWHVDGARLVFRLNARAARSGLVQTQKIRWVFPAPTRPMLRGLSAFTRTRWETVKLFIQAEKCAAGTKGAVSIFNGELVSIGDAKASTPIPGSSRRPGALIEKSAIRNPQSAIEQPLLAPAATRAQWRLSHPLRLTVRYSRPSSFKSDPTVLQFRLPSGAFGVAIEDVLSNEYVYLPDHGLFVTREPAQTSLAAYKKKSPGAKRFFSKSASCPINRSPRRWRKRTTTRNAKVRSCFHWRATTPSSVVEREDRPLPNPAQTGDDWFAAAGEVRPQFGGGQTGKLARHLEGGWLPIPVITVEKEGVVYGQRTFVAPGDAAGNEPARLNRRSVCVVVITVTNTQSSFTKATLALTFLANSRQRLSAQIAPCPRGFVVSKQDRPLALVDTSEASPLQAGMADGTITFAGTLAGQQTARYVIYLPGADVQPEAVASLSGAEQLRVETERYWKAVLASAMQVETPDELLNNVIRSSQIRCLIDARNEAGGARIAPWIAAMSYGPLESEAHSVIRGIDFLGHAEFARRGLEFFIHRYNTNGFLTTGYTTFGTAWHLWTLGEHYQLNRDTDWWQRVAPEVARVGQWIVRQTEKTKRPEAADVKSNLARLARTRDHEAGINPEYGLMPPGVLADWNAFAYHNCMNAYYYAALREIGMALSDIKRTSRTRHREALSEEPAIRNSQSAIDPAAATNGAFFLRKAAELRENIVRAYRWTQAQSPALPLRNGTWVPAYPSQVHSPGPLGDFFPGQDAGRSWCYDVELGAHQLVPAGVLDAHSREVTRLMEHMEDAQFLADGWFDYPAELNRQDWFNLGGFSKVQPYYTRNGEIYALRDDVKPFVRSYFNTLAAMLNPEVLTLWEHFHHSGAWDKTHETGYFLHQTRTMLVTERADELWLAPLITSNWLQDGLAVAVTNAPTRFGRASFRVLSHVNSGYMEAIIEPPTRNAPKQIVLRLRHPEGKRIRSVSVNGRRHANFDAAKECIRLKPGAEAMTVRARY